MENETFKLYSMLVIMSLIATSLLLFILFYGKYSRHMKYSHKDKWTELMNRDPAIEAVGEWIRWPIGSIYFLLSIFQKEDYDDARIRQYKKIAVISFASFIVSFILFSIIAALLPKL